MLLYLFQISMIYTSTWNYNFQVSSNISYDFTLENRSKYEDLCTYNNVIFLLISLRARFDPEGG